MTVVGNEDNGTTFMVQCHWSLLSIDVENKSAYYGDSLGWPAPYNLISVHLHMLECKLGINIHGCLQDIITIHQPHGDNYKHPEQCTHFKHVRTSVALVMCMVAVDWCKWNNLTAPQFPSLHGKYQILYLEEKIDVATLNKFRLNHDMIKFTPKKVDSMPVTPKCNTYARECHQQSNQYRGYV